MKEYQIVAIIQTISFYLGNNKFQKELHNQLAYAVIRLGCTKTKITFQNYPYQNNKTEISGSWQIIDEAVMLKNKKNKSCYQQKAIEFELKTKTSLPTLHGLHSKYSLDFLLC